MKCNRFYQAVEGFIGSMFAKYGRFVSRHAWKVLIFSILVNGGLGIGMTKLELDNDASNYLPSGTQSRKDQERIEQLFPYMNYDNYDALRLTDDGPWVRIIVRSKTGNLLTRDMIEELRDLSQRIQNISADTEYGQSTKLVDICAKTNDRCAVGGDVVLEDGFLEAVENNTVTYPVFNSSIKGPVNYGHSLGGKKELDESGQYLRRVEFIRFQLTIPYWGNDQWLEKFEEEMERYTSPHIDVAYGHYDSVSEELEKNLVGDISLFAGTMVLMVVYAVIATLSSRVTDQVGQRIWLGVAGILAAGLAIVASIGVCSAAGVSFVTIVGVVPFLIIGIGIDDMFILLSGLSEAQSQRTVEDKIAETLRISGVGVTITSLTDLIAFLSGAGSSFVAVKHFCIYTGVAVIFCYFNNITFFAACSAINERRVAENRHFMTCRRIRDKESARAEGKSKRHVICCTGRAPLNREEAESLIDKLPRWLIPKIVLSWPCKMIILILFAQYLAAAIYGCVNLKQGMLFTQLVSDDSYFYKYSDWNEKHFAVETVVTFVIPSTYDYSAPETQQMLDSLISSVQANEYFDSNFGVSWLNVYKASGYYNDTSKFDFNSGLYDFFNDPQYVIYKNDIIVDVYTNNITTSRIYFLSRHLADSQEEGNLMLESRDLANSAALDCFAFAPAFVVSELYVRILGITLQTVGIALVAVFVITCIFMPHPVLVVFVTLAVTSILAGVVGFMLYLDVSLSAISMLMLIMSIGFSVDFTAHICHGFMISDGETRDVRVKQAIDKTGAPIFHGAASSLLGILILSGAKSYIFRSFASVMSLVLLFGITHALFLLPVILSWFGPGRYNKNLDKVEEDNNFKSMTDISKERDNRPETHM